MLVSWPSDPREYWAQVGDFLLQREAENCVAIGTALTLIDHPEYFPTYHLFAIEDDGATVGCGWMTPPRPLCLTAVPSDAIPLIIEHARTIAPISGISAPIETAIAFRDAWLRATSCFVSSTMSQRIFELRSLAYVPNVEGTFRVATSADRALLEEWHHAFIVESGVSGDRKFAIEAVRLALQHGTRHVWQVGSEVVSMVSFGGPTPSGMRISGVYTPPEHRRRGYASAVVAAMTQALLDAGRELCFLRTDLANPTSNSIYQKLGYQPVSDSMFVTFTG